MGAIIVEPIGFEIPVECTVKTPECTWPGKPNVTPVWQREPKTTQIDVCQACLDAKLRSGEWKLR